MQINAHLFSDSRISTGLFLHFRWKLESLALFIKRNSNRYQHSISI